MKKTWKHILTLFALCVLVCVLSVSVFAADGVPEGSGTSENPYKIGTAEELMWFASQVNSGNRGIWGTLTADIDLNPGYTFTYIADTALVEVAKDDVVIAYLGTGTKGDTSGENTTFDSTASAIGAIYNTEFAVDETGLLENLNVWTPIGNSNTKYYGTFDGAGHEVSGVYINSTANYVGVFGWTARATVNNIGVVNSYIKGAQTVGAVVGFLSSDGSQSVCTYINYAYNKGIVVGSGTQVGGVVGNPLYASVQYCYNDGVVVGAGQRCGGVVGYAQKTNVLYCNNSGIVIGGGNYCGGVSGDQDANIGYCYNTGTVNGVRYVGGITGYLRAYYTVYNCYNTGKISGSTYMGGIVGYANYSTYMRYCYNDSNNSGCTNLVGENRGISASNHANKTTVQFASGEVAHLLGDTFGQTLGTDTYPTIGGEKVYLLSDGTYVNAQKIIRANMTLGQDLAMNYYAILDTDHATAQMRFTLNDKVVVVDGVQQESDSILYCFTLENVTPQCMGDEIKAELIMTDENGEEIVLAEKDGYSVQIYCNNLLKNNPDNTSLQTIIADLLEYGAASQLYTNYKTDALVNESVTGKSEFAELTETDLALTTHVANDVYFTTAGVRFDYVNKVYFKFNIPTDANVTVKVGEKTYGMEDFELVNGTTYILYMDAVYATAFDSASYTAEIYLDDVKTETLTYSIRAFVYSMQNKVDENNNLTTTANLARALWNYGLSADAYRDANA